MQTLDCLSHCKGVMMYWKNVERGTQTYSTYCTHVPGTTPDLQILQLLWWYKSLSQVYLSLVLKFIFTFQFFRISYFFVALSTKVRNILLAELPPIMFNSGCSHTLFILSTPKFNVYQGIHLLLRLSSFTFEMSQLYFCRFTTVHIYMILLHAGYTQPPIALISKTFIVIIWNRFHTKLGQK